MYQSRALTNDPSAARLISLAKLALASQVQTRDARGPYVIVQTGHAPGDHTSKDVDHLLGRSGEWLALHWFIRLPVHERNAEFVFGTANEVMTFMETLTGEVVVITGREDSSTSSPEEDEWHRTISGS